MNILRLKYFFGITLVFCFKTPIFANPSRENQSLDSKSNLIRSSIADQKDEFNPPEGINDYHVRCGTGTLTVLDSHEQTALFPRHDVELGRTELILRSLESGKILMQVKLKELWTCFGFNLTTKKYLIGSKNESGVRMSLRDLVYLDEVTGEFTDTSFSKQGFEALSSQISPDQSFFVFIGRSSRDQAYELYVMSLVTNEIHLLGSAPAAPPLMPEELEMENSASQWPWSSPEKFYVDLEASILSFPSATILQVSYGKDTYKKRSTKRSLKTWDLGKVFEKK